jgi:hypothetical protein
MMEAEGLAVTERVPLVTGTNRHNAHYLEVQEIEVGASPVTPDGHGADPDWACGSADGSFSLHDRGAAG